MNGVSEFDGYAADYDATVQAAIGASGETVEYFARLKAQLARAAAPDALRVLDFGCGVGNVCRALSAEFPRARITGCDPSAESIASAIRRSRPEIDFAVSDDRRIPFADGAFDLVVAACVFHHIDERQRSRWVAEVARVLRPGGRVAFFEHNPLNPLTRRVVRRVPFDAGVVLLNRAYARNLLERAGFTVRGSRYYFFFPRFLSLLRALEPLLGWIPLGGQYYVIGERAS